MDEGKQENNENLSDIFDKAFELYNNLEKTQEPTSNLDVQLNIKKCMKMLEEATKLVSLADVFSTNEDFEEVATDNMKYLLLPVLLGNLTTKLCDRENRMHNVEVSEIYYYDFLTRIKSYGIIDWEIPMPKMEIDDDKNVENDNKTVNTKMIENMVNSREAKLKRYREQKELKEQLETLTKNLNNLNIDEESKRKYFLTLIRSFSLQTLDEINSLKQEKKILNHMKQMGSNELDRKKPIKPSPKLQPIIITKNLAQKMVFGAGYPSLPVMTVEEFYEKKVADGEWKVGGPGQTSAGGKSLQDMASSNDDKDDPDILRKEEQEENDDEDYIHQARAMDEYKDTHKRGWGNRYNRS